MRIVEAAFDEPVQAMDFAGSAERNELDLARHFGVATSGVREFLNRFQHYGLIEKRPNSGWVFKGFTIDFALLKPYFHGRCTRSGAPFWFGSVRP